MSKRKANPKYSPTPWNVAGDYIRSKATRYVGFVNLSDNTTRRQANAARICACVNACEGISNEALESGVLAEMRKLLECAQVNLGAAAHALKNLSEVADDNSRNALILSHEHFAGQIEGLLQRIEGGEAS